MLSDENRVALRRLQVVHQELWKIANGPALLIASGERSARTAICHAIDEVAYAILIVQGEYDERPDERGVRHFT